MKRKDLRNLLALLLVLGLGTINYFTRVNSATSGAFILDTYVEIMAKGKSNDLEAVIDSTFALMKQYEEQLSFYKGEGELRHLNQQESVDISSDIYEILKVSEDLYNKSDGLYDVSIGQLSEVWDFDNNIKPTEAVVDSALQKIGFSKIRFDKNSLQKPLEVELNLGSLAKGYIIDKAVDYLQSHKVSLGFVNAGGDIRIFGQNKPLVIGIQHPRNQRNEIIGKISVPNMAIVTSGDYERFFMNDGKRYHHILNPKTGYPAHENISSTVVAESALLADAWSTASFLMNREDAVKAANQMEGVEVLLIYEEDGELKNIMSEGMKEYILELEI